MITDALNELCDATSLNTGAAGTYNIGSEMDLGVEPAGDITVGKPLWLVIQVNTTATSGGSATGQFRLVSGSATAPSTSSTNVMLETRAFAVASMTAGTVLLVAPLPSESGSVTYNRYLRIQQITGTAAFTAGKIDAFVTADPTRWKAYAEGVPAAV